VSQRGFTLIELLVVLVIVGIMLGLAGVRLAPDDEHTLTTEMRRLAVLLEQARDEAVTTGEPIAFSVERARYRFWRRDAADAWVPYGDDDDALRDRDATAGVRLMDWRAGQADEAGAARVLFLPSGASTPFSADFALNAAYARLRGDSLGRVRVETSFGAAS
jgi:type II secretion system protein H